MNLKRLKKIIAEGGPIPLDDLSRIVDLMEVPSEHHWMAALEVQDAADRCRSHRKSVHAVPYKRIARAATELLKQLQKYDGLSLIQDDEDEDMDMDRYIDLTEMLRDNAEELTPKRQPNRPKGSVKNKPLQRLMFSLYNIAEKRRGKMPTYSFDTTREQATGTLVLILAILSRHLPKRIPAKIPYSTLHRMRRTALRGLENMNKWHDSMDKLLQSRKSQGARS